MADLPHLSGSDIRDKFLKFYESKQHKILPSASLIPEDPTVMLTIAGMLPFKPIFLGQRKAPQPRATTSQKCIRTNDIENVGRTARHHTFFEMLGNFSFGDYFKEIAIAWAWELSTQIYNLPADRIVPSVFEEDDEAFAIWRDKIGIPEHRIQRMGKKDNFGNLGLLDLVDLVRSYTTIFTQNWGMKISILKTTADLSSFITWYLCSTTKMQRGI